MSDFSMQRVVRGTEVRYLLEGVFAGQAAFELIARLKTEAQNVELDFSKVRQCFDFGLAALATELQRVPVRVELFGLSTHHRRLLQYFGLDLDRGQRVPLNDDLLADPQPTRTLVPA
jgi:hypothetical protein